MHLGYVRLLTEAIHASLREGARLQIQSTPLGLSIDLESLLR